MSDEVTKPDLTRFPAGEIALSTLVRWCADQGDVVERHYLELKGPEVDVTSKVGAAKVAKFVLGAANRDPARAADYFDGWALMLVGVTQGAASGVPRFEVRDFADLMDKFLGTPAPRWDFDRFPVSSDRDILVIKVEPPKAGDLAWVCRASGDKLRDGAVYIRAEGATREATSVELDMLFERAAHTGASPDLSVEVLGEAFQISADPGLLERYVAVKAHTLLKGLPAAGRPDGPWGSSLQLRPSAGVLGMLGSDDRRSEEQFRASVTQWADEAGASWESCIDEVARSSLPHVKLQISNLGDHDFEGVQVRVHLDGDVRGLEATDYDLDDGLPSPPLPWGEDNYTNMSRMFAAHSFAPYVPTPGRLTFKNGGSVDLEFEVARLRPRSSERSPGEEVVLIAPDEADIHGTWEVRIAGVSGVYKGELNVKNGGVRDLSQEVRRRLHLGE